MRVPSLLLHVPVARHPASIKVRQQTGWPQAAVQVSTERITIKEIELLKAAARVKMIWKKERSLKVVLSVCW